MNITLILMINFLINIIIYIISSFTYQSNLIGFAVKDDMKIDQNPIADKTVSLARDFLNHLGFSTTRADIWNRLLIFVIILLIAFVFYMLINKVLVKVIHIILRKLKITWENYLYEHNFFNHVLGIIPPVIVLILLPLAFSPEYSGWLRVVSKIVSLYIVLVVSHILISFIHSMYDYHLQKQNATASPYKGVVEMLKIVVIAITVLLMIGIVVNVKITNIITYLSAFAAVLVLVFKDTLLGFIAGIQLAQNNMLKIGDWITVNGTAASGTIVDITILTVKIQNFDNTYVYVPAYSLVSGSFQNWSGMYETKSRRMSKSLILDIKSVNKTTQELIAKLKTSDIIKKYITDNDYKLFINILDSGSDVASTNLGLYRVWLSFMMIADPAINNNLYQIVENEPSDGAGLPINIMFWVNTTVWKEYEDQQSRIYEKFMIALESFDLSLFQYKNMVVTNNP